MRHFLITFLGICLLFTANKASAQTYGNEWIDYGQTYYKVKTAQDGIYRITFEQLQQSGIALNGTNPQNLQMYFRGQEVALKVEGEADSQWNAGDYIEFYGKRNDGTLDNEQKLNSSIELVNPYYNLYSDSTSYFFTFSTTAGKRISSVNLPNTGGLSPEPYHWQEELQHYTNGGYSNGINYPFSGTFYTYSSYIDDGEGYMGRTVTASASQSYTLPVTNLVTTGPDAALTVRLAGGNNISRNAVVSFGNAEANLSTLHTASFSGFATYKIEESIPLSRLTTNQAIVKLTATGNERYALSYVILRYPQAWAMSGASTKTFRLPAGGGQQLINVSGVSDNVQVYDITDEANISKIEGSVAAGVFTAVLPASGIERKLFFTSTQLVTSSPQEVNFTAKGEANYLMVSHASLRADDEGDDPVADYMAYRASAEGGSFNVSLVDINDLYNEFSYGEISPLAIRHYVEYMSRSTLPEYLLLIGKSINVTHQYHRNTNWTRTNHDLVPTYGVPGADIPFTMNLNGSGNVPAFPVGRISARYPSDVRAYLNKVKETESDNENNLWKKRALHLSGGNTQSEARTFIRYLENYAAVAEGPYYGAKIEAIKKSDDVVVQEIDVSKQVNNGVGLITFFGHSAPTVIDIEIGYASDPRTGYSNQGMYPTILVNGCYAGDIFKYPSGLTFSEDWVTTADKGAINFIAHSSTGYNVVLHAYSTRFYDIAYAQEANLDKSIGKIQKQVIDEFLQEYGVSPVSLAQAQQVILQGDPAVKLFGRPQTDYHISNEDLQAVSLDGNPINAQSSAFDIQVVARNFAKAVDQPIQLTLSYELDGDYKIMQVGEIPGIMYQDTIALRVNIEDLPKFGDLRFKVSLNADQAVAEEDYTNNDAYLDMVVPSGGTLNLWPYPFAVVNENSVKLKAQATDILKPERAYSVEAGSDQSFAQTSLQSSITSKSLFEVEHNYNVATTDTLAQYWRSKISNPDASEDQNWVESSFTYLANAPEGWAQIANDQFKQNKLTGLQLNGDRSWDFEEISKEVAVKTFGKDANSYLNVEVALDGFQYILRNIGLNCANNSMAAIRIDGNTLETYVAKDVACGRLPQYVNSFNSGNIVFGNNDDYNLEKYLTDIPTGDWVVLFSIGTNNYQSWPASVHEAITGIGLSSGVTTDLQNGEPFIIIGKKGSAAGTAVYARADPKDPFNEQTITLTQTISGAAGIGYVETDPIGPAKSWQDVVLLTQADAQDAVQLEVVGIDANGAEAVVNQFTSSGEYSLAGVSAQQYPKIKLRLRLEDMVGLSAPDLRFWRVGFTPEPEGVLVTGKNFVYPNEVAQGQNHAPELDFINITPYNFSADSLQITQSLLFDNSGEILQQQLKIKAPAPLDTTHLNTSLLLNSQTGLADLSLRINTVPVGEYLLSNNQLLVDNYLNVLGDSLKPYVDVAFDGVYIANGDIVSPTAQVAVVIRDDNRFAPIQDTTGMQLYLRRNCAECEPEPIYMRSQHVRFSPATETQDCKVEFQLEDLETGRYTLEVQAADRAGNKAGEEPYAIAFEVVREKTITNFYPYPNPFSTSTRFVFTLTGNEVPKDFKIQILTVRGTVVREIFKEELGPIRIGNNISNYAWDGTDQWGDKLANGVYLYRVVMESSESSQWEASNRDVANRKAFKDGWGKLYILR